MARKNFVLVFIEIVFVLVRDIFISLINLFLPRKKVDISGQTALVTGGGNGLGRQIAFQLASKGCNVVICDIDIGSAQKTCEEIKEKYNVSCEVFKVDIADVTQVEKLRDDIKRRNMNEIDILINNAGILSPITALEGDNSYIQRVIDVNLTSHFWTVRTFLPSMIERRRGSIVGICSVAGLTTIPCTAAYSTTKFGVSGFYRSLIDDLCVRDYDEFINVSCIYPGYINTSDDFKTFTKGINLPFKLISLDSAAKHVLHAILNRKNFYTFSAPYRLATISDYLPFNTRKFIKKQISKFFNDAAREEFRKTRN